MMGLPTFFLPILLVHLPLLLALATTGFHYNNDDPVVETLNGFLSGKWETARNGRIYSAFEGIPYATFQGRYNVALPPQNWQGLRNATVPGAHCPQFEMMSEEFIDSDEDCLFLNVYVPRQSNGSAYLSKLPVMFYIHGGGYILGSGYFQGAKYLMSEAVIFVTINYRLGNFGFLALGDEGHGERGLIYENNALNDMILALKWTGQNIERFGGDPTKVFIFGESAGSTAVHAMLLSPAAQGLIAGAISQSGSLLCHWVVNSDPREAAMTLAKQLNCPGTDPWNATVVVDCLRSRSIRELLEAELTLSNAGLPLFAPTIDPRSPLPILPDTPYNLITQYRNNSASVPYIIGRNEFEGLAVSVADIGNPETVNEFNTNWNETIAKKLDLQKVVGDYTKTMELAAEIKTLYFKDSLVSNETLDNLTNIYSDFFNNQCIRRTIILHAQRGAMVFPYQLTYHGNFSMLNLYGYETQGVAHGDDLQYLFDSTTTPPNWYEFVEDTKDLEFSKNFVTTWVSFAQNGVPTSWETDTWSQVPENVTSLAGFNWLQINESPQIEAEHQNFAERMAFWENVFVTHDMPMTHRR